MALLILASLAVAGYLGFALIPRIVLRVLTKGRIRTRGLRYYEVYDEIGAELKARRLAAEVRREAGNRSDT